MKRLSVLMLLAIALAGSWISSPVSAQDATPVASPMAEPSEEGLPPVTLTEENGVYSLTVVEIPATDTVLDTGPMGDSLGDWLVFSNALFDESNTTLVGLDQGWCMRSRPLIGVWECTWTSIFSNGNLVVQGAFYDNSPSSVLAVTGGTGDFANASGQMTLTWNDDAQNYTFAFEITM